MGRNGNKPRAKRPRRKGGGGLGASDDAWVRSIPTNRERGALQPCHLPMRLIPYDLMPRRRGGDLLWPGLVLWADAFAREHPDERLALIREFEYLVILGRR